MAITVDVDEVGDDRQVKDPRTIARGYQLEMCKRAVKENIIVYLETGCGKTHIAVLLIYELRHLIRKPQKSVCVFLAPTVHLVQQQTMVIEHSTHFKVGSYFGTHTHLSTPKEWGDEIEKYEVLVMTPEILLHNLHHSFMKMEAIALLIFDECHHAQKRHPYAQIMTEFYKRGTNKLPRVFGLTASPVIGRGGFHQMNYSKCINTLEKLLDAKVCTVEDKEAIERIVPSPYVRIYFFQAAINSTCQFNATYISKLEKIKEQCIHLARSSTGDIKDFKKKARLINRLHGSMVACLEKLGLWASIEASNMLQSEDSDDVLEIIEEQSSPIEEDNVVRAYLRMTSSVLDLSMKKYGDQCGAFLPEALEEPFFSNKLLVLIAILSLNRKHDAKCIIFVSRIITARVISHILGKLKCLSFWKCDFLVGFHSRLNSMSRQKMNNIVHNFRAGKVNLLVATNVAEEGLDIQTCCLIVRFDLPATVASYIQSRGRARMQDSEYLFLVERDNDRELNLVNDFISGERHMNSEILHRTSQDAFDAVENSMYKVESTGASISTASSVSLLHHYCSTLPRDEYYDPVPEFFFFDGLHGVSCHVVLPSNAPIRIVEGPWCTSKEDAKRAASLEACKKLHELDSLTGYLLPYRKNEIIESSKNAPPDPEDIDELSGPELYEMIVPAILRVPCADAKCHLVFHFYYLHFRPIPADRCYRMFGLFLSSPLPKEGEAMQVDLHLARSRIVRATLVPSGTVTFTEAEIRDAENFQEMCLKIMLDREVFMSDCVQLGSRDSSLWMLSTYYLLLPLKEDGPMDRQLTVDWNNVRNCLSSPAFNKTVNTSKAECIHDGSILQSASGSVSESVILNSLVFTPHNKLFFFISGIFHDINGKSRLKDGTSYAEHYLTKFKIELKYPEQPLLKAKQLCNLHNLLPNRIEKPAASGLEEHFVKLPPELCVLKIKDFPKDIGSSLSLLPSLMHRVESFLVAVELKEVFSTSFPEGSKVTASRVLEALTTEKCSERFSLERLEVLGDSFLKYAVSRHLFLSHAALDEGKLTSMRSSNVNNINLYKLAIRRNIQVYIRDECFNPNNFFAFGRPCTLVCDEDSETIIHGRKETREIVNQTDSYVKKCRKNHQVLYRKTIADAVEALVGAFLVDSGFKAASSFSEWMGIPVGFSVDHVSEAWNKSQINLTLSDAVDVVSLEKSLEYRFSNRGLLLQAFTHASRNSNGVECYQRLEFLGDAVVDYIVTSYFYSAYPDLKPGHLTDLRALRVSNNSLGHAAVRHSLHTHLLSDSVPLRDAINKFVEFACTTPNQDLLEEPKCPKVLGDLVESCAGAILLDSGFDLNIVWKFTLDILDPLSDLSSLKLNPLRELQELCQSRNVQLNMSSSSVKNSFIVQAKVEMQGASVVVEGRHQSKRAAEKRAAEQALAKLKADHGFQHNLKSLRKIENSPCRQNPFLIGYDEMHVLVELQIQSSESMYFQEVQNTSCDYTYDDSLLHPSHSECRLERNSNDSSGECWQKNIVEVDQSMHLPSAKSRLHQICTANYWDRPSFFCCKEEGPSHMKLFTYKVRVEVCGPAGIMLECFSEPRNKKKDAAEHAAEGALWWLDHHGYLAL